MRLEGIHHITCVTADAPSNADFYVRVLGLRIVKKTVNQVDKTTYHIFYGDERASYGNNISFFEYRGRPHGRAGAGNVHTIVWRVGDEAACDFWERRLAGEGVEIRGGWYQIDPAPAEKRRFGGGVVQHVAWGCLPEDIDEWSARVEPLCPDATGVVDRHFFRSSYFTEPGGVLFEIAEHGGPG